MFYEIKGVLMSDTTGLIKNLLQNNLSKGTLITRPRRLGKTLAMCMLADFFDIRKADFDIFFVH